jgi:hypothetical protein
MIFELLNPTAAKIDGKEHSPAVDLRISFDTTNGVLDMFDGCLLTALYHKAAALQRSPTHRPIDYGMGGTSHVVLGDCAVNGVQISPKEGGTVTVTVRVQCSKGILLHAPEVADEALPIEGTPEQALADAGRVSDGRMTQQQADERIGRMQAAK